MFKEENAIALRVLVGAAKAEPDKAPVLWQAARILLNSPVLLQKHHELAALNDQKAEYDSENYVYDRDNLPQSFPALRAEFDYADDNGLCSHRTVWVMGFTDGREIKRNKKLPPADRYGYLLTGYCTLRKQIRSFRSSRISNLRTFIEGEAHAPNRQWWVKPESLAG